MDWDAIRNLQQRLVGLERYMPRYRQGVITDDNPLAVALGGSDVSYTSVRTVAPGLQIDDVVGVLVLGNDLIVLGKVSDNSADWTDVSSFANSWVNYDTDRIARYYRHDGRVYLEGIIKNGTVTASAFTLPIGYRHSLAQPLIFPVVSAGAFGVVAIYNDGTVVPTVGSNTYFDLSAISFRVA